MGMIEEESDEAQDSLLLIDDDALNTSLIKAYLDDYGFFIHTATSGMAGLQILQRQRVDLIMLDLRMPVMSGFEVCDRLKDDPVLAAIPVVIFTASKEINDKIRGFQCGAVDYITKPVQKKELVARVINQLNFRRIRHNLESRLNAYQKFYGPLPEGEITEEAGRLSRVALQRIERVRERLIESAGEPPTLEALSEEFHVNAKRLSREFQAVHGLTMYAWLRDYRLREAARMLRETDKSIEQIAQMNGYNGGANFATAFKRRFQVSPREYRRGRG